MFGVQGAPKELLKIRVAHSVAVTLPVHVCYRNLSLRVIQHFGLSFWAQRIRHIKVVHGSL